MKKDNIRDGVDDTTKTEMWSDDFTPLPLPNINKANVSISNSTNKLIFPIFLYSNQLTMIIRNKRS